VNELFVCLAIPAQPSTGLCVYRIRNVIRTTEENFIQGVHNVEINTFYFHTPGATIWLIENPPPDMSFLLSAVQKEDE
jgi:hypothetical protein